MKNINISAINSIEDEQELLELRKLILYDLRNVGIIREKTGDNEYLDDMVNLFLDQLSAINKRLE